jgi:hypothetical protein
LIGLERPFLINAGKICSVRESLLLSAGNLREVAMASRPNFEKPNVRLPNSVPDSLPDRWVDLLIYLNEKEREEDGRLSGEKATQRSTEH